MFANPWLISQFIRLLGTVKEHDAGIPHAEWLDAAFVALDMAWEDEINELMLLLAHPHHVILAIPIVVNAMEPGRYEGNAIACLARIVRVARKSDAAILEAVFRQMIDISDYNGIKSDQDHRLAELVWLYTVPVRRMGCTQKLLLYSVCEVPLSIGENHKPERVG
jgi:hypothetical protein